MAERAAFFHALRQFLMKLFPTEESFFVVVGNGGRRKAAPQQTRSTPESRSVSPIIIARFAIKQLETFFGRNRIESKSRIRMKSNIFGLRSNLEISRNSQIFIILFEILKHADKVADCNKVGNALQR